MDFYFLTTSLLALLLLASLSPIAHSLSTVAISETGNQTLICAVTQAVNYTQQSLNCTSFPQGVQIQIHPPFNSISGIVGGNGFLCALTSSYSLSQSVMVCWRFSILGNSSMTYKRIYIGPLLTDLDSGNSHICGLVNGSTSLQCWQWKGFNPSWNNISSSLAVGENFLCGLSGSAQVACLGDQINVPMGYFTQVAAGPRHACAVSRDGSVHCWGSITDQPEGIFTSVTLGENRNCAIRVTGTVLCWGENGFNLPEPFRDKYFLALEGKRNVFCGIATVDLSLHCWGNDIFNSNSLVFRNVVPGSCRAKCPCGPLFGYGKYCAPDLMVCQSCDNSGESPITLPMSPSEPIPPQPRGKKWDGKMVAFMVVGCVGSLSLLLVVCIFLFPRYIKVRSTRIHDSGRLEEGGSSQHSDGAAQPPPPSRNLSKKLSHLISLGNGGHLEEFSLQVLLRITDNFSEEHKIGTGSFGSVYHATLDDDREVAIKRAETTASSSYAGTPRRGQDKDTAFLNELELLSRLNHKNLVRLLGYCEDSNERVLVYEYMRNGTLFDHLYKLETSSLMSWAARIKVALDAARGIEYLHEYAVPHIIHRDIKSSNILLDAMWTAKVSDFGLSLMGPQDKDAHISSTAAGTMGYMDPEYYRWQRLTPKSDVYSFGIVMLELLSGCKAIQKNENGIPRNVVDYVVPYIIQDEIHRVLDKRVPPPTPFEIEAVAFMGSLAADCVMPEGQDRPTMSEIVNSLDRALQECLAPQTLSRSTSSSSTQ